ncbi:uncharacterized protein LOC106534902 [Austrofundulus limnaeus]|uniref:Uncharacterized protein LOC106534902 n=1 Tax=Austrofundulus limnaeus TaxID=52670 RepID=A0A2I4D4I4_AUSLI|nr:PREDICTED: uncharacterized protein LOC106534902 [Austrofundulus limnaeus]
MILIFMVLGAKKPAVTPKARRKLSMPERSTASSTHHLASQQQSEDDTHVNNSLIECHEDESEMSLSTVDISSMEHFPAERIASKTRRPKFRLIGSKQRKTLKHTISADTQNEIITDHHSQQQEISGAAVQTSTLGPAGQYNIFDHMYSTNIGYERRNVSAPTVKLKQRQRATPRHRRLQTKRDEKCSDTSVLRLSETRPLGFGTYGVTISPQDVGNLFVKRMFVIKTDPPEQPSRSLILDQEDQKPPQIKEEIGEVDVTDFISNPDPVKSEDEEEKPQLSERRHSWNIESAGSEFLPVEMKEESFCESSKEVQKPPHIKEERGDVTEFNFISAFVKSEGEEEKPQPSELHHSWCNEITDSARSGPDQYLEDKTLDSSETDVSDGDWEESNEPRSDLFSVETNEVSVGDNSPKYSVEKPFSCSVCFQCFKYGKVLISHNNIHDCLAFTCNVCSEGFEQKSLFVEHMKIHAEESLFSFSYN